MQQTNARKGPSFFGESTESDAPYFALAEALGAWGKPPSSAQPESVISPSSRQGDLFDEL